MSDLFFQTFCTKDNSLNPPDCTNPNTLSYGTSNMYGPGLYASTDPVATAKYGSGAGWVLLQIRLPKGFRYFDLKNGYVNLPQPAIDVLHSYGCGNIYGSSFYLDSLLAIGRNTYSGSPYSGSYSSYSNQCVLKVRQLLKDYVKMDGFIYSYSASTFEQCSQSYGHQAAFVLTSSRGVSASHVRVFNSQTDDNFKDRLRIQTLFYYADIKSRGMYRFMTFPKYPGYKFSQTVARYTNEKYEEMLRLCVGGSYGSPCVEISKPPEIGLHDLRMSPENAPDNMGLGYDYQTSSNSLLWTDMQGAALDFQAGSWLPNYLFGCKN